MKILLLALNAKYIHSNPAVYSLKACAEQRGFQAGLLEFTINQKDDEILRALYRERPGRACSFRVYMEYSDSPPPASGLPQYPPGDGNLAGRTGGVV